MGKPGGVLLDVTPLQTAHRHRGIGTYCAGLLSGLAAIGHAPQTWGFRDRLLRVGIRPDNGPRRWDPRAPSTARLIAQLAERPLDLGAVLHVTNPAIGQIPIPRPYVTTAYDLIPLLEGDDPGCIDPGSETIQQRYLRHLRDAEAVVAISQATRQTVIEFAQVQPERVVVAHPGLPELPLVAPQPEGAGAFLVAGTPEPHKNIAFAIDVAAALPPRLRRPLLATGAPKDDRWRALVARAGSKGVELRVLGRVSRPRLAGLYRSVDAVLVPSRYEGFGLPALEALSVGAWVVVSDRGALPEAVGSVGRIVPLDVDTWVNVLAEGGPSEGERARAIAHARSFKWETTAEQVVRAWDAVT